MQDPSYGIPRELAFQYLFDAPKVVKQHATMSWQYLTAPQDGTIFLTWAAPRNNDQFPSDGYFWEGPEERMMQEFGGYVC
ncbi:hypothetical protein ANO11243_036780 [Dothideomycetidae sp. 11243]|nr:hypothetical protein ANO11243_036780 [fungal sp. No.11243]